MSLKPFESLSARISSIKTFEQLVAAMSFDPPGAASAAKMSIVLSFN